MTIHTGNHSEYIPEEKPEEASGNRQSNQDEEYAKEYDKCAFYFKGKRGLSNDFIFSGRELENLKQSDRLVFEQKTIECCKSGDTRFFPALEKIKLFNLKDIFTSKTIRSIETVERRIELLTILYRTTRDICYLLNLLWLASCSSMAYYYVNTFLKEGNNTEEVLRWKTDSYRCARHALKTINVMRISAGKAADNALYKAFGKEAYKAIELMDSSEIKKMIQLNPWHFDKVDDYFQFYMALLGRAQYLRTNNIIYIKRIIYYALIHLEVYDVLWYMKQQGEIDEKIIRAAAAYKTRYKTEEN